MALLWSEHGQFQSWLDVEIAACAAWSSVGVIPADDVERLRRHASIDIDRIHELEKETRHDVVAFTRAVSETLGPERKWVHYGLTSSDVVDTAWSVRLLKANALIREALGELSTALAERARELKHIVMMGRTHGIHAEPTTMGLKLALWFAEMQRQLQRFEHAAEGVRVGKVSGAVGTFAHIPPEVEAYTCRSLGLEPAPISTQVLQRDRHAHYVGVLALIGGSLEKMAVEIRHLQRTEVGEVEESFGAGQKGSSAMPHKRNPVGSENITGCSRLLRGYMLAAYENMALWHERDISHSSAERVLLPDATTVLHYALHRFARIVRQMVVFPDAMRQNLERSYGLYNSQRLLLMLVDQGMSREKAYDMVQPLAMNAWREKRSFKELVLSDECVSKYLSENQINQVFDVSYHLRHVNTLFSRAGV